MNGVQFANHEPVEDSLSLNALGQEQNRVISSENQKCIDEFIDALWLESGLSDNTLSSYRSDLSVFCFWLQCNTTHASLISISHADVLGYLSYRFDCGYKARSTARLLSLLKRFYLGLMSKKIITVNPMMGISMPKLGKSLPQSLSEKDVMELLHAPDTESVFGIRDRAMLEVLYATGLRVTELISLTMSQLNLHAGWLRVSGKGKKERVVPLGEIAVDWLGVYLKRARSQLLKNNQSDGVFLSSRGHCMSRQAFWQIIKRYAKMTSIQGDFSPHTLRHAFATHLLNHGADLRTLQILLGHADLSTTQIYTHIAKDRLQRLHSQHHPRG